MQAKGRIARKIRAALLTRRVRARYTRLNVEQLEGRHLLAFSILNAEIFGPTLKLVADFNQPVNAASVQASDLQLDGSTPATSFNVVDADTIEFIFPTLIAGSHSASLAAGAISDTIGTGLDPFTKSFVIAGDSQFTVNQNPRLQPGNAPLAAYAGGNLDRADILWQTIPGGVGTQDTFTVQYRAGGATAWQIATLNADIATNVENRVVRSASISSLNWNANYEYRVRHWRADVIVAQFQNTFRTRLQSGDATPFTFAAYGDSASDIATGFRQVQGRINQNNPAFTVLLGDNVYDAGSHLESDARFSPTVNPEAATWMASHIDYLGLGNHDIGTGSGLPAEQNYSVPIPVSGVTAPAAPPATERPEHSFSWDYGNVHFVTFDTNSLSDSARLDGLLNWVITDLNASTARWKIVYGHHPLAGVPDKPESAVDNYYQQVVNRLKAAGVDLLMTGHSHTYSWTYPLTGQINGVATFANHGLDDQFVSGEGLPQLVSGLGGKDIRTGDYSQFPFVATGFTASTPTAARLGYSQVSVSPNQLTVSYVAADNGAIIDSFTINKDDTVQTTSFQQGANGYSGTVDTFLHQNTPSISNATATSLKVDSDDPAGTNKVAQSLLRFDNLFGSSAGQIPSNATIRSATLQLQVSNGSVSNMNLHRMLATWGATDTWDTLTGGVQTNGVEALLAPDTSSGQSQVGAISFNVLSSLQAWLASPTSNKGWALIPTGTDGVDFNSSEGTVKPKLIVSYVVPTGPNTPPTAVNDTTTTNLNTAVAIAVLTNDTDSNGDFLTVTAATQPGHGATVVNTNGTVTYTPANGFAGYDSFSYSISDGRGGTSTATVNVTIVQSTSFQQGVASYAGTFDTFVQQNAPTVNNGSVTPLNIDGDDPGGTGFDVQALLRFDNLFGNTAGQIPAGATLQSATLQVQVSNAGNSLNLHRMLANWTATDTWNSLTGGVQNDGVEALAAADLATGALAVGAVSLNVLPSLLAWQAAPTTNRGWAFLPTGTDGVDFDSAEGTTKPKLIVTYIPNSSPTVSDIANQSVNEDNATGSLPLVIGDVETVTNLLIVSAVSSNTTLLPNANLVFGGSGVNRTLTATPAPNQAGSATITITVTDAAGAIAQDTFVLTVNAVNDAPSFSKGADPAVAYNAGPQSLVGWATAITAGPADEVTQSVNFQVTANSNAAIFSVQPAITSSGTLTFAAATGAFGSATISINLQDNGGTASGGLNVSPLQSFTITVNPPPTFQVTTTTPTTTAVVINFSRDLDVAVLNLYDTQGTSLGPADVTLVGAGTGGVQGSLFIDSSLRRMTFVRTSGVLLPDSYTLTIRSAANGAHDTGGTLLDGDANGVAGGDFVTTFTVDPPLPGAVTLSIPNLARGPQQTVNVPATATTGLPIFVSNGAGITSVSFQLKFDPSLLSVTGAAPASGMPAGTLVNMSTSVDGVATIQFTSPTPLPTGSTQLLNLQASVPSTAPYRSKSLLDFTNLVINGGSLAAIDDDAIQVVAYFGDVTANGTYSAQDASFVARLAVGIDTGLEAYKLLDPVIVGDVTGNGTFSATDTSLLLQAAVGITVTEIPTPLPTLSLVAGGPDPKLSIPRNLTAASGQLLTIPIDIDSIVNLTDGLASADLVLYFDPQVLEITSVSLGRLVAGRSGWLISSRIDPLAGRIDLSLAGTNPLVGQFHGELVQLQATVKSKAPAGATAINLAASSRSRSTQLNEGFLTLIPAPTDAANDAIDGLLTITPTIAMTTEAAARRSGEHLLVTGTAGNDLIIVSQVDSGHLRVRLSNHWLGTFTIPQDIFIDGLAGNNFIYVDPAAPTTFINQIQARSARNLLFAGSNTRLLETNDRVHNTDNAAAASTAGDRAADVALLQFLASWQQEFLEHGSGRSLKISSIRRR